MIDSAHYSMKPNDAKGYRGRPQSFIGASLLLVSSGIHPLASIAFSMPRDDILLIFWFFLVLLLSMLCHHPLCSTQPQMTASCSSSFLARDRHGRQSRAYLGR